MQQAIFSIRDKKLSVYGMPFFFETEVEAKRYMGLMMNRETHQFYVYAEDFELVQLGTWNDKGEWNIHDNPIHICELITIRQMLDLRKKVQNA